MFLVSLDLAYSSVMFFFFYGLVRSSYENSILYSVFLSPIFSVCDCGFFTLPRIDNDSGRIAKIIW